MTTIGEFERIWRWLRRRLATRSDTEHEQALIRIAIFNAAAAFVFLVPHEAGQADIIFARAVILYCVSVGSALAILCHIVARPRASPVRRLVGMVLDLVCLNGAMFITGHAGMLLFPLLLWTVLGHGFRFGRPYLFAAAGVAFVLFGALTLLNPVWREVPYLDVGLLFSLIILPGYFAVLLRKLTDAVDHAEDANRAKSKFLATMSHEFRTPLNAIIGMTDLMRTTRLDHDQKDMTATIRGAAKTLLALVNDVLDIAKIEAKQFTIENEPFDLHVRLAAVRAMLFHQATNKGLYLRLRLDPTVPHVLEGGARQLHQVLVNLVANAVKFTDKGGVLVDVRQLQSDDDRVRLRFEVQDTGIGISTEQQKLIFDRFSQVSEEYHRRSGGTGLGLSIALELVQLMNGTMGLVSNSGSGSSFWFELPLIRGDESGAAGQPDVVGEAILLGDDASVRLVERASPSGIRTTTVPTVDAAIDTARAATGHCTILLCDGTTSRDVRATVEALNRAGLAEPIDVITMRSDGAQFPGETLCDLRPENAATDVYPALRAALAGEWVQPESSSEPEVDDLRAQQPANLLLAEDNKTNQRVLMRILEYAGHKVDVAETGDDAVELVSNNNYDAVLMDINMPGTSGFEAVKMLRFVLAINDLPPFIALTADATSETRKLALDSGFSEYLTKPIDAPDLISSVDRIVAARRPKQEQPSAAGKTRSGSSAELVPHPAMASSENPLDEKKIKGLLALDAGDGFFASVVDDFLEDAKNLISELSAAAERGDIRALRDAAHALKSSSAHVGVTSIFERCTGWRELDDHALLMRADVEIDRVRAVFEQAKIALLERKDRAHQEGSTHRRMP